MRAGAVVVLAALLLACCGAGRPRPVTAIPAHIRTWAYVDPCNGGGTARPRLVRSWVSYAEANCGVRYTRALRDCHAGTVRYCTVIQYIDPNIEWSVGGMLYGRLSTAASESWWVHQAGHTDARRRIRWTDPNYGTGYLLNQSNPAVDAFLRSYVRANFGAADGLLVDDTSASLGAQLYGDGRPAYPAPAAELRTNAAVLAEHRLLAGFLTHRSGEPFLQIDNSWSANPFVEPAYPLYDPDVGVRGLIDEGAPWSEGTITPDGLGVPNQRFYATLLDDAAWVEARSAPSTFLVLLSYERAGNMLQRRARLVQEATVLLAFSPGRIVDWADLEQGSKDLAVWPEEGVYPTAPVQSMGAPGGRACLRGNGTVCATGGHNDLQVASGVYRREFGRCFDRRLAIGGCAAIVNDSATRITVSGSWLRQRYGHELALSGGDVQSGGKLELAALPFKPGSTALAAYSAAILTR